MTLRHVLVLSSIALHMLAGAQVNNNCSGAIDIDLYTPDDCPSNNFTLNFNTSSISTNPPFCDAAGSQIRDFWYRFYSANNTTLTIYLQSLQSSHIGFGVYSACGGGAVACLSGVDGFVDFPVSQNTHYYLQVYTLVNADPSNTGIFCLHWNNAPPAPPANDDCTGAPLLNVGGTCTYTNGNSSWATFSNGDTPCNPEILATNNDDVWYRFVAPAATTVITVDGDGSGTTGYDPVLIVASASSCAGPFNTIECSNTTGPGGTETITTDLLVPGFTYYVRVYDVDAANPQPGSFGICVNAPVLLGLEEEGAMEARMLLPTNTAGRYTLRSPFADAAACEVYIRDAMGRTVRSGRYHLTPAGQETLDLYPLAPGTYLITVQREGEARTQRFAHF